MTSEIDAKMIALAAVRGFVLLDTGEVVTLIAWRPPSRGRRHGGRVNRARIAYHNIAGAVTHG